MFKSISVANTLLPSGTLQQFNIEYSSRLFTVAINCSNSQTKQPQALFLTYAKL